MIGAKWRGVLNGVEYEVLGHSLHDDGRWVRTPSGTLRSFPAKWFMDGTLVAMKHNYITLEFPPPSEPEHTPDCAISKDWVFAYCTCKSVDLSDLPPEDRAPKCDCGGAKARTSHSAWCSTQSKK